MSTNAGRRRTRSLLVVLLLVATLLPTGAATAHTPGPEPTERLLVTYRPGTGEGAKAAARATVGASWVGAIERLGVEVLHLPEQASSRALAKLRTNPAVASVEADQLLTPEATPNDPAWGDQWGPKHVQAPAAWSVTTGAPDVRIAVLDSGVTVSADLQGKVLSGHNAMDGSANVTDNHGHGTRSASVAAAATNNGLGIAGYCWQCTILPVKVFDSEGAYVSDIARGMVWATDNGADVISLSMSGPNASATMLNGVRYASERGVVVVAAAGNYSSDAPRYPAAYPEVIGVAGTTSTDALYSWSNHGAWVDVSAPGNNQALTQTGGVVGYSGTSSATPAAAGVIGLGLATGASAAQVRRALEDGAVPLSSVRTGRIDAAAMLALLGGTGGEVPTPTDPPPSEPAPTDPAPKPGKGNGGGGKDKDAGGGKGNGKPAGKG
ncbi:S8 family serine peptidase [Egicoccus sp. AB-alg2]|uniref:S8 family serine peptidase n=1 Tax=Egicoccus sp. AB-alg2 TaxID=3242693 RepID=UPI00359DDD84